MSPPPGSDDGRDRKARVRERLRREHATFLEAIASAGRATAENWETSPAQAKSAGGSGPATTSRAAVIEPFEAALREADALERAPAALATAVDAAGGTLQADPVPAPPYVVVTATGVVLRATTDVGRVVVSIEPFAVRRDPVRYEYRDVPVAELVDVAIRE